MTIMRKRKDGTHLKVSSRVEVAPYNSPPSHQGFIGVDPGASGGIAWILNREADCISMPDTERDILDYFRSLLCPKPRIGDVSWFVLIEKVGGYVATSGGQQQAGHPGSAMFKFGQSYGALRMALTACNIPFEEVSPVRWQKGVNMVPRSKKESKTEWKNRLKARAQQLFPRVSVTLKTADALLIAEHCRRSRNGV